MVILVIFLNKEGLKTALDVILQDFYNNYLFTLFYLLLSHSAKCSFYVVISA